MAPPFFPRENLLLCLFDRLKLQHIDDGYDAIFSPWVEGALKSGHPVLTTNYDSIVEWYLAGLPTGEEADGLVDYGVPRDRCLRLGTSPPDASPGRRRLLLLKLYGSISWSYCGSCNKYVLDSLHQNEGANTMRGKGKCSGCSEDLRRNAVFVPLVGQKNPTDAALQSIWGKADQVLSQARKIVFSGFSLNPTDQSVWALLTRACCIGKTEKVAVVMDKTNEEVVNRYKKIYGKGIEIYDSGWKQFLKEQKVHNF
jgi:hypothetical protein